MPYLLPNVLKGDLKPIAKIGNIQILSSPQLQQLLYGIDSKTYPSLSNTFKQAIRLHRVNACVVGGGLYAKLVSFLGQGWRASDFVLGFFSPDSGRVYLILSSITHLGTKIDLTQLLGLQAHELQHAACGLSVEANNIAWKCEQVWFQYFLEYCTNKGIMKKGSGSKLMPLWHQLCVNEVKKKFSKKALSTAWFMMAQCAKNSRFRQVCLAIANHVKTNGLTQAVANTVFRFLYIPILHAYLRLIRHFHLHVRIDVRQHMFYQEFFWPSEIVSVMATTDYKNPVAVKLINIGLKELIKRGK